MHFNTYDFFTDYNASPLFYHMFEQFSPALSQSGGETTGAKDDIYQDLINMHSFGVIHDCPNVPFINHHFMMYGPDSKSEDCQDVTDMMLFIPDYRMMDWPKRGTKNSNNLFIQDYFRYNAAMQPTMGLYVIRQKEITPTTAAQDYYMINLNWVTTLDNFLPSDEQEFELLEVVVDEETGVESYVPVYYKNAQGQYIDRDPSDPNAQVVDEANRVPIKLIMSPGAEKNYPNVYVKREDASKQVTYAIRGRDAEDPVTHKHFLSLQISNRMSYIVPGTDPTELVLLKDATHYSRFDANRERVRNAYSNKIVMGNNVDGMKQSVLESNGNVQMTISRVAQVPTGSTAGVTTDPVTIATLTFNPSAKTYTVEMTNQVNADEFPKCADGSVAGYHANNDGTVQGNGSWSGTYYVTDNNIDLGKLEIFDNFVQEIPDDNTHPFGYIYNVTTTYPCPPTAVYMSVLDVATSLNAGNPVYYANTWNNGDSEAQKKWVKGVCMDGDNTLFKFTPVKDNIIFVRMDPAVENEGNEPGWDLKWNQSPDLWTPDNMGKTYYIWNDDNIWDMNGGWSGNTTDEMAHGNTFRIPIYKTSSQINGFFAQSTVDEDATGTLGYNDDNELPTDVEFGVGVQLSSRTEILRYDTYRWTEGSGYYTLQSADGDDEQDIAPTGLAMNQGEYYTISMNPDTDNETNGSVSVSEGTGTATFVDEAPADNDEAAAYVYAPIVEVFSGRGEGDYNSYGGPLQSTAVGKFEVDVDETKPYEKSAFTWSVTDDEGVTKNYAYYNVYLKFKTADVPTTSEYELYKVRVWRDIDLDLLGEQPASETGGVDYGAIRKKSNYLYDEITWDPNDKNSYCKMSAIKSYVLGQTPIAQRPEENGGADIVWKCTFGAQNVSVDEDGDATEGNIASLPMNFKVRAYFTKKANLSAPTREGEQQVADGKYYIVEHNFPYTIAPVNGEVITEVNDLNIAKEVIDVIYFDAMGRASSQPHNGVNIVVTRYTDGSTSTTKVIK